MLTIRVPATIANMGPGFDTLCMAVSLYNTFSVQKAEQDQLIFSKESSVDVSTLPDMGNNNILFKAMNRLFHKANQQRPSFSVNVIADIPVARGLGSSSTAVIAGLVAANQFLGNAYKQSELLTLAIEIERHPDNVAPALLGGVVLYDTTAYQLPWSVEWRILTLSPSYPVLTEEARRILPKTVSLEDSIFNMRKTSVLTYALLQEDPDALRAGLQDRLHQPYRRKLIHEYDELERLVMDSGALGMIISGSGSSMAVFYPTVIHAFMLEKIQTLIEQRQWELIIQDLMVDMDGAQSLSN